MATKTTGSDQIKSRKRVKEHGEVFTNPREVKAMCDLVGDTISLPETTVLEPACGTGNFLAEILVRKMRSICNGRLIETERDLQSVILAVGSLYGVDIMADNVEQTRERLFGIVARFLAFNLFLANFKDETLHKTLVDCDHVLCKNIQVGNFLQDNLVFCSWKYKVRPGTGQMTLVADKTTKDEIMKDAIVNK